MDRKQTATGGGRIDFRRLRETVSMEDVLALLGWRAARRSGAQLRGPCPVHGSPSPASTSFAVHLERNVWRCFSLCDRGGNQLDLFAQATRQPIYQAALELCERLGIDPPRLNG